MLCCSCPGWQWALSLFVSLSSFLLSVLFFLPAFTFSSQNIAYRRFPIGQCLAAHPSLYKCIFPFNPPCSMDPNTSNLFAPSRFPPPLLPLLFFFLICFFFFLVFFFSAGELSAAEAAGGAQHGGLLPLVLGLLLLLLLPHLLLCREAQRCRGC